MNSLENLTKSELLARTLATVAKERKITFELINFLREVERRMLYAELGFSSLWEFCVKHLGLSEGSAQRRISAMRLARDIPLVAESLENGKLNLTTASQLQSFFKAEKKQGKNYSPICKKKIIDSVAGLSKLACDQKLAEISPASAKKTEKVTIVSPSLSELKLVLDSSLIQKLDHLKNLLSHQLPLASYAELIEYLTNKNIADLEKRRSTSIKPPLVEVKTPASELTPIPVSASTSTSASASASTSAPAPAPAPAPANASGRQYISIKIRREVWQRAENRCEFINSLGERCFARYSLAIDHIKPISLGGLNNFSNLRILCRNHNNYQAKLALGACAMKPYLPSLRSS